MDKQNRMMYITGVLLGLCLANTGFAKELKPQLRFERCFVATLNICQFEILRGESTIHSMLGKEGLGIQNASGQSSYGIKEASVRAVEGKKFLFVTGEWLRNADQNNKKQVMTLVSKPTDIQVAHDSMVLRAKAKPIVKRKNPTKAMPMNQVAETTPGESWSHSGYDDGTVNDAINQLSGLREGPSSPVIETTHEPKVQYITFDF